MRCHQCGLESGRERLFIQAPGSLGFSTRRYCPRCALAPLTAYRFLAVSTALALAAGPLLLHVAPGLMIGAWIFNFGLLQLFLPASTIAHELGHAAAARLAGFRTFRLEIGHGPPAFSFHALGFRWQFLGIPSGGRVHCATRRPGNLKARWTFIIAGGPAVNALLLAIAWLGLGAGGPAEWMAAFSSGLAPFAVLAFTNALLLVYSLWPLPPAKAAGSARAQTTGEESGIGINDVRLTWRIWRDPHYTAAHPALIYAAYELEECQARRDPAATRTTALALASTVPGAEWLEGHAAMAELDLGRPLDARQRYIRLLGRYGRFPSQRLMLWNNIAWADYCADEPRLLDEAEACSQAAFAGDPANTYYQGTRAAVLIARGQLEEGIALILEAIRRKHDPRGLAANACVLAHAESLLGHADAATRLLAWARQLDPQCPLLLRPLTLPSASHPTPGPDGN